jgi:hypothetical protein
MTAMLAKTNPTSDTSLVPTRPRHHLGRFFWSRNMSKRPTESRISSDGALPASDPTDVERLQQDVLACLRKSGQDPISYTGLAYCSPQGCGRVGCSEACAYGNARRRRLAIPRIAELLTRQSEPLYEVRAYRPFWPHDLGELVSCDDIRSARCLVRRVLDNLFDNTVIAVGTYKTKPFARWVGGIHLIVAAHDQEALTKGFKSVQPGQYPEVYVEEIRDLETKIEEVLDNNLPKKDPNLIDGAIPRSERTEFYKWLLTLDIDARVMRYGCDQAFSPKERKQRTMNLKPKKKHPYPYWLERYFFGSGEAWRNRPDPNQVGFVPKNQGRAVARRASATGRKAYYEDDDENK